MSGLFTSLNFTARALDAESQAINVTSNNIANINSSTYSREQVTMTPLGTVETAAGPESLGLETSVEQERDPLLDQMVMRETGVSDGYTAEQGIYQRAQAALGESITNSSTSSATSSTSSDSGLQAAISGFFSAVQNLAANPSDESEKEALLQQAGVLTDRFQQVDQNLAQVQADDATQASSGVDTANGLLTDIANLNTQIGSLEVNNPGSAVNLRDQREADLEQLAGLMPVTVQEDASGEVQVSAATSSGTIALVTKGTVTNPLSYSSGVVTAGTGSGSAALSLTAGSIFGTVTADTGAVQTLRNNLDALAHQLVTSVNKAYNPGNTSGKNFFAAAGTTAGTIALDSNLTDATLAAGTGAAGDNSLALAVGAVANQTFSTAGSPPDAIDGTISQFYANTVSGIGQALNTANNLVEDQTNVLNIVTNQRASVSGVSLNEEMTNLMTYQRTFQASSEVFSVISGLLDTLVNHLGTS